MSAVPVSIGALAGVRELASLRRDELATMGEEAADLARVVDLGVPCGAIWVIGLSDDAEGKVLAAVTAALALDLPRPVVELGGFFRTHAHAARFRRVWPSTVALRRGDDVRARVHALFRALDSREMRVALGGGSAEGARTEVGVRVTVRDEDAHGHAASVDPRTGDPEIVAVWAPEGKPALLDRKTMRPLDPGSGLLRSDVVERAADVADRAQLALGRPVELSFGHLRGRLVVLGVRPLTLAPCFTEAPFRRVALLSSDEGPIAPLAIDALDRALRTGGEDMPRVVRIYARAYRRVELGPTASSAIEGASALARTAHRATQIVADFARPVAEVRAFEERLERSLVELDRRQVDGRDGAALLAAMRERQRLVVDALSLLERARVATLTAVSLLEATCGTLPREAVRALAAIRRTRARRRAEERLLRLAQHVTDQLGDIPEPHRIPPTLRKRWDEVKAELRDVRPLGLDVRPVPFGANDAALRAALLDALGRPLDADETARREAVRRVLATARVRPLGRAREGVAGTLAMGLAQLADIKGRIGEALAIAMLRLRASACDVGAYLVEHGVLDDPEDALYLDLDELVEAISGEPGAYASRVRLRREADLRWRHFDPPRQIAAHAG